MKYSLSFFALAALGSAQQFVLYSKGEDCDVVERSDPIVSPGSVSAHVHHFLGANTFDTQLSYEALQNADCTTVGAADGSGNAADKSVYWHPALYVEKKDGSGLMKIPVAGHKMYYRKAGDAGDDAREPFEFPNNFRMVAADPYLRGPATAGTTNIVEWKCFSANGVFADDEQFQNGGFPSGFADGSITDCANYPGLSGNVHFPHCWDGQPVNDDDPASHMTYPLGHAEYGKCPPSHPTRLPHIFMENLFDVHSVADKIDMTTLRLSNGDPTGFSYHADFFNGWDQGALPQLYATCPQGTYGNHDVGTCPSYKKQSKPRDDCKLPSYHHESVHEPGTCLPGCNPVTRTNPAPKRKAAALGVSTDSCDALAIAAAEPAQSQSKSKTQSKPKTYSMTQAQRVAPAAVVSSAAADKVDPVDPVDPASTDNVVIVQDITYETKIVTVTSRASPSPAPGPHKRHLHQHQHMGSHRRAA